jgi:hypothetical protein
MEDTTMTTIHFRSGVLSLVVATGAFAVTPPTLARTSDHDFPHHRPRIVTLFAAAEMPHTERTVAIGQRVFVTSDANLFEVVKDPHGRLHKVSVAQATVTLTDGRVEPAAFLALAAHGRVLYATATAFTTSTVPYASTLYRIELGPHSGEVAEIARAPFVGHATPFMPNGMAVDRGGDVFVSNSFSASTGEAAILKLKVRAEPFSFQESNWLPADLGGAFPNGIQLEGDTLYLASMSVLLQVTVERNGGAGPVSALYSANPNDFLDDFVLLAGELIVCEIDNPFAPPTSSTSQLTIVKRTGPNAGTVARVIPLAGSGIHPSSIARDGGPEEESLLVTDYTGGGLFSVSF